MKKQFIALVVVALFFTTAFSQGQGQGQRMSREERAKQQLEQMTKDLGLNKDQVKKYTEITKKYDTKRSEMMQAARDGGGDMASMREKMGEMNTKMQEEVKKILDKDQIKKYEKILKEQAEQRAQRGGRGGGGRR